MRLGGVAMGAGKRVCPLLNLLMGEAIDGLVANGHTL